ncbi:MAG: HlyD family efflux transporter periplasmic adaptor subunit [Spirulina sp. SIO3F2]|nr:HlyD family efflux transporter periplasmic adaptor subunit [Spirulina sp. SIO3F2]
MNKPGWGILPLNKWTMGLAVTAVAALGVSTVYSLRSFQTVEATPAEETEITTSVEIEAITALGRIEPEGEVVAVSSPPSLGGAKVEALLVKEGQIVKTNQVIAKLDNFDRLQAAVLKAQRDVEVAQADLNIVRAGAKQGEIAAAQQQVERLKAQLIGDTQADQATIARIEAEVRNAQIEYDRYYYLYHSVANTNESELEVSCLEDTNNENAPCRYSAAVSRSELDQRWLTLETARKRLEEAKAAAQRRQNTLDRQIREALANLNRVAEVRPVDVQRAQARVRQAQASLQQAKADLTLGVVRSPFTGQVLTINTYPGETVSEAEGIVEVGRTNRMIVVAEVYESDISQVKPNQTAIITSENNAFTGEMQGTVTNVGLQIGKKDVLDTDPAADVDVRVVEVDIELDGADSKRVANLTNAKVLVKLLL